MHSLMEREPFHWPEESFHRPGVFHRRPWPIASSGVLQRERAGSSEDRPRMVRKIEACSYRPIAGLREDYERSEEIKTDASAKTATPSADLNNRTSSPESLASLQKLKTRRRRELSPCTRQSAFLIPSISITRPPCCLTVGYSLDGRGQSSILPVKANA
jgi:hypothetical protein